MNPRRAVGVTLAVTAVLAGVAVAAGAVGHTDRATAGPRTATVAVGDGPTSVAVDPTTHTAVVVSVLAKRLTTISTVTGAVGTTVALAEPPTDVAVDPATGLVFVSSDASNNIAVYDETGAARGAFAADKPGSRFALDSGAGRLFTVAPSSFLLQTFQIPTVLRADGPKKAQVLLPHGVFDVVADPRNQMVWIADAWEDRLLGYAEVGGKHLEVRTPSPPYGLAIDRVHGVLWTTFAAHREAYAVSVGDVTTTPAELGTVTLADFPTGMAVDPVAGTAYAVDEGVGALYPIDEGTRTVGPAILVGRDPRAVAVDPSQHVVITADSGGSTVTVVFAGAPTTTPTTPATTTTTPTTATTSSTAAATSGAVPSATATRSSGSSTTATPSRSTAATTRTATAPTTAPATAPARPAATATSTSAAPSATSTSGGRP